MAQFLKGKQAGISEDLSAGLKPELFLLDTVARYGINSQVSTLAYDPLQSLLAVGTNETQFGQGQIYLFGQKRVCLTLSPARPSSIRILQFCAHRLISIDSKNDLTIYDLNEKRLESLYSPPGRITSITSDSTVDYIFIGLQNGETIAYDIDRQGPAQLRIPCLWVNRLPNPKSVAVVSLSLHPRDIGTMLIAYTDGVAVYSFKQNKAVTLFQYELPPGAPGGYPDTLSKNTRHPKVVQATWHPTGTFVLTAYDDGSLVIWDPKSGNLIQAFTLDATNVNKQGFKPGTFKPPPETSPGNAPLSRVLWCCKKNPDDTAILVAGGLPANSQEKGLTFIDFGPTPIYQTSSWQVLSDHFEKPKDRRLLKAPLNAYIVDLCTISRSSPHYAGCQDPIAIIAVLSSGELTTLSLPSGYPISPSNQFHPSISFISPFANAINLAPVSRSRWLGMIEKRSHGPPIVTGGALSTRPLMRFEDRYICQTAHVDGTIRMWDIGHGDEIENPEMILIDLARALPKIESINVSQMSLAGSTGEFSVGLSSGEVVIFRWGRNENFGRENTGYPDTESHGLLDIRNCSDPSLKEGFLPLTMLPKTGSVVTALRNSAVGFVAVGYRNGDTAVIDLRGPALIYNINLSKLIGTKGSGSRRQSSSHTQMKPEWATVMEFGVLSLEGEDYSSIVLFVGTNLGRIITFKLLPSAQGAFSVQVAGSTSLDGGLVSISPLNVETGKAASATPPAVARLREGQKVNGVVVAVTTSGARIFKPVSARGANKVWSEFLCDAASVVSSLDDSVALVGLFGDGIVRTFSIPGLKELAAIKVSHLMDVRKFTEAKVASTGDIIGWTGPSEIIVVNPWGSGQDKTIANDRLMNPDISIPPRPTISNVQWISGTQYFTPADLDMLVGGDNRPPSKRMVEQMRTSDRLRRDTAQSSAGSSNALTQQDEGYWAYMQRQVQERTEKLNVMGESMDRLEETSANWAEDVGKFVSEQKKKAVMGAIGSKFGF